MDHEKIHLEPGETCRCRKRRKLFTKPLDFSRNNDIVKLLQITAATADRFKELQLRGVIMKLFLYLDICCFA